MEKFKAFVKTNWKFLSGLLVMIGGMTGGILTISKGGGEPGIHIVLPEDAPDIFGTPDKVVGAGGGGISFEARRALRMSANEMRRRGGEREKLFDVLRVLHNDESAFERIEAAAKASPSGIDPATIAIVLKIAIQVGIAVLERVAPNTPNTFDDRLLALLKLFQSNPAAINAAHAVAVSP